MAQNARELMTQAQYARSRGKDPAVINRQIRDGLIPTHGKRRLIDPEEADRARQEGLEPRLVNSKVNTTYAAARAKRQALAARLLELQVKQREGELLLASDVEREQFQVMRVVRERLLALPDRLFQLLAAEQDPMRVHELLKTEIRTALIGLAKEISDEEKDEGAA